MPATRKYFKIAENLPFKTVKDIITIMRLQRNLNTSTVMNAPMSSLEITSSSVPITQNMNSENPAEDGMKAYMDRIDALMQNTKANIVGTLTLQKIENNYHLLSELGKSIVELEERFENTPSAFKHILVDTLKLPQFPVSARKDLLQQALELNHQVIEILHQAVQEPGSSQFN